MIEQRQVMRKFYDLLPPPLRLTFTPAQHAVVESVMMVLCEVLNTELQEEKALLRERVGEVLSDLEKIVERVKALEARPKCMQP